MTMLIEEYDGEVPERFDDLLRLPGVARKTANVVSAERGNAQGIVVDTHVRRLSQRLGFTRQEDPVKIERDLMRLVPRADWARFPHLLIWHGRRICVARYAALRGLPARHRPLSFESGLSRHSAVTRRARSLTRCAPSSSRSMRTRSPGRRRASRRGRSAPARASVRRRSSKGARAELTAVAVERLETLGLLGAVDETAALRRAAGAGSRARRARGAAVLGRGRAGAPLPRREADEQPAVVVVGGEDVGDHRLLVPAARADRELLAEPPNAPFARELDGLRVRRARAPRRRRAPSGRPRGSRSARRRRARSRARGVPGR